MSDQYPPQYPSQYPSQDPPPPSPYPSGEMYPPPPPQPAYPGAESYPPPPPPYQQPYPQPYPQPYQQPPSGYAPPPPPPYAAVPGYSPIGVAQPTGTSKLAIASLICGIVGLCTGVGAIAAVICGHLALSEIKKTGNVLEGRGMAIAGLVLGYLEIVGIVVYIIIVVIGIAVSGVPQPQ